MAVVVVVEVLDQVASKGIFDWDTSFAFEKSGGRHSRGWENEPRGRIELREVRNSFGIWRSAGKGWDKTGKNTKK